MKTNAILAGGLAAAALLATSLATPASANAVSDFYKGKTMTVLVGFPPGGGYDSYARLLAGHWNDHIPGHPAIIVQNMPGAGGIKAANYLYNVAKPDGLTAAVMIQGIPTYEVLHRRGVNYKSKNFTWIGSLEADNNSISTWSASGVTTIKGATKKTVIMGAVSPSGTQAFYPAMANALLGTKFKVIPGYKGTPAIIHAMEQGGVQGVGAMNWSSWTGRWPNLIKDKKITILAQIGLTRNPEMPGPLLLDLAPNKEARNIMKVITADVSLGRTVAAPPKISSDRAAALRKAFMATTKDSKFLAEAKKRKLAILPKTGKEVTALVGDLLDTPSSITNKAMKVIDPKSVLTKRKK